MKRENIHYLECEERKREKKKYTFKRKFRLLHSGESKHRDIDTSKGETWSMKKTGLDSKLIPILKHIKLV